MDASLLNDAVPGPLIMLVGCAFECVYFATAYTSSRQASNIRQLLWKRLLFCCIEYTIQKPSVQAATGIPSYHGLWFFAASYMFECSEVDLRGVVGCACMVLVSLFVCRVFSARCPLAWLCICFQLGCTAACSVALSCCPDWPHCKQCMQYSGAIPSFIIMSKYLLISGTNSGNC